MFQIIFCWYELHELQCVVTKVLPGDKLSIRPAGVVGPGHDGAQHGVLPPAMGVRVEPGGQVQWS